jgi:hypothetical protein
VRYGGWLYCTQDRGFSVGRAGSSYAGVCPPGPERGFLVGYADGQLVHAAEDRLSQARRAATAPTAAPRSATARRGAWRTS